MAACTASSSMIFSTSCCFVFTALGPAFSNFLNSPSTVLWSSRRSVMASMGEPCPNRSPLMHAFGSFGSFGSVVVVAQPAGEAVPYAGPLGPHDREVGRVPDGAVARRHVGPPDPFEHSADPLDGGAGAGVAG